LLARSTRQLDHEIKLSCLRRLQVVVDIPEGTRVRHAAVEPQGVEVVADVIVVAYGTRARTDYPRGSSLTGCGHRYPLGTQIRSAVIIAGRPSRVHRSPEHRRSR